MKKFLNIKSVILLFIIVIAAILRLYQLDNYPVNLTPDEASLGYNAYSILKTARDEYGTFMPLTFKSFGDHKPGLYIYLTVPFVALLGLNEWAVRLPSALLGVLAVWLVFKIASLITPFRRTPESIADGNLKSGVKVQDTVDLPTVGPHRLLAFDAIRGDDNNTHRDDSYFGAPLIFWLPYLTAFTFAISPWHINFSRGAWEANVSLIFTLLGIYFFLKNLSFVMLNSFQHLREHFAGPETSSGRQHQSHFLSKDLTLSALFFGLTFWTYQGAKLSTLLVLLALLIAYWRPVWTLIKTNFKQFLIPCSLFLVFILPILYGVFTGTGGRLEVFSIFSYERPQDYIERTILKPANIPQDSFTYTLFHSEPLNFLRAILHRYFHYFSGQFLAFEGDWSHPQLTAPYTGVMHWPELIPFFIGFLWVGSLSFPRRLASLSSPRFGEAGRSGRESMGGDNSKSEVKTQNLTNIPTMGPHRLLAFDAIREDDVNPKSFLLFILLWLFLAPLPAALSRDEVNAVRSLNLVIPLVFFISIGWWIIFQWILKQAPLLKMLLLFCSFVLLSFSLVYYLDSYYVISPYKTAHLGQGFGYKQIVETVQPARQTGKTVILSQSYDQPYIYFLFYEKYDPTTYQRQANLTENPYGDVGLISQVDGHLQFRMINWTADQKQSESVFIGNPITTIHPEESSDPSRFHVLGTINYPNNHPAFQIVEVL